MKIFFLSPNGFAPMKKLRLMMRESHGWTPLDNPQPPFAIWGMCVPAIGVDAMELVDALTAEGVIVMPSLLDQTPIPAAAATALAQHGVLPTDTTMQAAQKIHAKCGMPPLRPHLY